VSASRGRVDRIHIDFTGRAAMFMFCGKRIYPVATLGGPQIIKGGDSVFVVRQPTADATLDLLRAAIDTDKAPETHELSGERLSD
jgi:hypothetical protein